MTVSYNIPGLSKQNWPKETSDDSQIIPFYGRPWLDQSLMVNVPIPWKANASHILVHKKCADSLARILKAAWDHVGHDQSKIDAAHLNYFSGSYNDRANANDPSRKSMHAFGIALDWADPWNPNGKKWSGGEMLPQWFADCFLAEGWMWLSGKYGTADPMHFQATLNTHPDAPADGPAPQPPDEKPVLEVGASGPFVIEAQQKLGIPQTGSFDDNVMLNAVTSFQMNNGLDADGVIGKATWAKLDVQQPAPPQPGPLPPSPISVNAFVQQLLVFLLDVTGVQKQITDAQAKLFAVVDAQAADMKKQIAAALQLNVGQVVLPPAPPPAPTPTPPAPIPSPITVTPLEDWQSGKGSWYSQYPPEWRDPGDRPRSDALGVDDIYQGVSFPIGQEALGSWFEVVAPNGIHSIEQQSDKGPSVWTHRGIDISAVAAAKRFKYTPHNFPTDAIWKWRRIVTPKEVTNMPPQEQAVAYYKAREEHQTMPQVVNNVPVGSAATSKINGVNATQVVAILAVLATNLSHGMINIDADTQAWIITGIGIVGPVISSIFRTWFTTKITPQSLARMQ